MSPPPIPTLLPTHTQRTQSTYHLQMCEYTTRAPPDMLICVRFVWASSRGVGVSRSGGRGGGEAGAQYVPCLFLVGFHYTLQVCNYPIIIDCRDGDSRLEFSLAFWRANRDCKETRRPLARWAQSRIRPGSVCRHIRTRMSMRTHI